jgi:hypothetical protein
MRDLRDPQKLGQLLLGYKTRPLTKAYDRYSTDVADVSKDDSMCRITTAEYRAELESRTDKYAKSALERMSNA